MADAVRTSNGEGVGAGGVLAVGRPSGRPLAVLVCPSSRQRCFFQGEGAAAVVFVSNPERIGIPDGGTLQEVFGLTLAEAKLTRLLAHGASLMEAGVRLGLRRETVRSRVKSIFAKTNTHRQAELVRLVIDATPEI
ncbi:MAG TPA: helix-turn-helix transcriptional regulator [Vicinamibacterales bacterium]|nr:helix-turn-helix transcriptional regulator [Vicinamibacterales bacterium]